MLTKDDILKADDIEIEPVEAWHGTVYVRGMTGTERDAFEASVITMRGTKQSINLRNVRAKLCVMTLCEKSGARLFEDSDMEALSGKAASELQKVFAVAQRLSGITEKDVEELTEVIEKSPFDGSVSD
jgi:hypothetical protein